MKNPFRDLSPKTKKRLIFAAAAVTAVLLALAVLLITVTVRRRRPPALADVLPRIEELVEASHALNGILYGEGLPTYPRVYAREYESTGTFLCEYGGKETTRYYFTYLDERVGRVLKYQYFVPVVDGDSRTYADVEKGGFLSVSPVGTYRYATVAPDAEIAPLPWETAGFSPLPDTYLEFPEEWYYEATDDPDYDFVRVDCGYLSTEDIVDEMRKVYAEGYLASISESFFTGLTVSERESGTLHPLYMDFKDEDGLTYLLKYNKRTGFDTERVYDFGTAVMVKPSRSDYINVEVDTWLAAEPDAHATVRLSFAYENGNWYLDSPTY